MRRVVFADDVDDPVDPATLDLYPFLKPYTSGQKDRCDRVFLANPLDRRTEIGKWP
jgi:hypothetical protein